MSRDITSHSAKICVILRVGYIENKYPCSILKRKRTLLSLKNQTAKQTTQHANFFFLFDLIPLILLDWPPSNNKIKEEITT
jgi:hypothetical protein